MVTLETVAATVDPAALATSNGEKRVSGRLGRTNQGGGRAGQLAGAAVTITRSPFGGSTMSVSMVLGAVVLGMWCVLGA